MKQQQTASMYVLFNPANKQFTGFSFDEGVNTSNLLVKTVKVPAPIDILNYSWQGDYDTGRLVDGKKENLSAVVNEVDLTNEMYEKLYRKYDLPVILTILIDELEQLRKDVATMKTPNESFTDLNNHWLRCKIAFLKDVEFYSKSDRHQYITKQQAFDKMTSAFSTE